MEGLSIVPVVLEYPGVQLDAIRKELEDAPGNVPAGEGEVKVDSGAGITSNGHIITGDNGHVIPSLGSGEKAPLEPNVGGFSEPSL